MDPYVGHLTVPVLGYVSAGPSGPQDDEGFAATWLPSVEACHASGRLIGFTGLIENRFEEGTVGPVEQMGVVVDDHGVPKILFAADRILESGGASLLCAAYDALQHRQRHLPYHVLFHVWKDHMPDDHAVLYARVFSHPKGWVIGVETPRDSLPYAFEHFDGLAEEIGHDPDGFEPLDLVDLEDEGDIDMGAIAAVIVRMDPPSSAHEALRGTARALDDARAIYDAWRRACPHWITAEALGVPADLPIEMATDLSIPEIP